MVKVCWSQSTGVSARVESHVIWSPFAHNPCTQAQFSLPDTPPPPPTPTPIPGSHANERDETCGGLGAHRQL